MAGLMRYLYGAGKENEHTNQRAIASSGAIAQAYPGALNVGEASGLGRLLERSWYEQMREARALVGAAGAGTGRADMTSGEGVVADSDKEHVYHVSLSLPPGQSWTDEQWATVAEDFVEGMGFTTGPDDDKGCRWIAVHHGQSAGGNDHVHIAVNMVRQDGRRAQLPANDYARANQVREEIENTRDFVLPLRERGRTNGASNGTVIAFPGYSMTEARETRENAQTARENGTATPTSMVPDRVLLQQVVRAAATASSTEVEWLNKVLDAPGVEIEAARWAPGGMDTVTGYRVRIGDGRWFTSTQLAADLSLGKMRPAWEPHETDQTRADAHAIWSDEVVLPDTYVDPMPTRNIDIAETHLTAWVGELGALDPADKDAWRAAARDAAGVATAIAANADEHSLALIGVGQTLSRQALHAATTATPHGAAVAPARPVSGLSRVQMAARHIHLAVRAASPVSNPGWIAVLQQLRQAMNAIEAAQRARGELVAARQLAAAAATIDRTQSALHDRYGGQNLASLRETWQTREVTNLTRLPRTTPAPATGTDGRSYDPARIRLDQQPEQGQDRGRAR